jgi:hypothetical protein
VAELEACLKQATQPRVIAQLQRLLDDWDATCRLLWRIAPAANGERVPSADVTSGATG